jgi:hypothetical protein
VGIIGSVCSVPISPSYNLKFELRPSWNNIHDTFPTETAQDTAERLSTILYVDLLQMVATLHEHIELCSYIQAHSNFFIFLNYL